MTAGPLLKRHNWFAAWTAGLLLATASWSGAQTPEPQRLPDPVRLDAGEPESDAPIDPDLKQTGCHSCGGGLFAIPPAEQMGTWGTGECGAPCYPGRRPCDCGYHNCNNCVSRMCYGIYHCICCPDPCYEPQWLAIADSAFFTDAARPKTQMKLRWDSGYDFRFPDRAEYFWAREGVKGPPNPERTIDRYKEFRLINEAAADKAGISIEVPYLRVEPEFNDAHSGFGDIVIGTKAMLIDCALLQTTFQFKTFIPTGVPGKGLGTGHVSLEPALLWCLKLTPVTYLQAETAYWIPIGGDPDFQGEVFHYHFSLNQMLYCCGKMNKDFQLIGTFEFNGWSVLHGRYTEPIGGGSVDVDAVTHMASMGPGLRFFVCDRIDLGLGTAFAITENQWAGTLYRAEFRWRF